MLLFAAFGIFILTKPVTVKHETAADGLLNGSVPLGGLFGMFKKKGDKKSNNQAAELLQGSDLSNSSDASRRAQRAKR